MRNAVGGRVAYSSSRACGGRICLVAREGVRDGGEVQALRRLDVGVM